MTRKLSLFGSSSMNGSSVIEVMSGKKQEFIPNFASGGKKPLGPAPRIGLSRKVRPSPKQFKSPLLNPPVNYPDYAGSSPGTADSENSTPKEKILLSSGTSTTPGVHSRIGNRKKANCKKNLQENFDDKTALKLVEVNAKESEQPDNKKNKVGMNIVSEEEKVSSKEVEDIKTPEDSVGGRRSSRKRAAKKVLEEDDDYVEETIKDDCHNSKKGKRTLRRNEKNKVLTETHTNNSTVNNLLKSAALMDVQIVPEDVERKTSNRRPTESDNESPPKLTAITPENNRSGQRNASAKTTPDCPLLSPANCKARRTPKAPSDRLTRSARKILAVDEDRPGENLKKTEGQSAMDEKEKGESLKATDSTENEIKTIKLKKVLPKTNKRMIIQDDSSDEDNLPATDKHNVSGVEANHQTLKKAVTNRIDYSSDEECLPRTSYLNSMNPEKIAIPRCKPMVKSDSSISSRLSLRKHSSTNLSDRSHLSATDKMAADDFQLEVLRNEVETLQQQVVDKEKEVEGYKKKKERTQELEGLIKVWEQGSKDALISLHQKLTSKGENIDMDVLLKKFNAPEDKFKFDSFNYSFV